MSLPELRFGTVTVRTSVGTVAVALLLGPAVEGSFWALTRLGWAERPSVQSSSGAT